MVDLEWKSKMISNNMSPKSPKLITHPLPLPTLQLPLPLNDISTASFALCNAYDNYLRLPQLRQLWASNNFPGWAHEPVIKPALHALEITFRFLSTALSDPRPYTNARHWARRLESLAKAQIQLIATLCEDHEQQGEKPETRGNAPFADVSNGNYRSYSQESLLPKLATWQRSKDVAQRILATVETEMMRCPYTLGLGEPNLAWKPILCYDAVCTPTELHSLETTPLVSQENLNLHATHQIVESWLRAARVILERVSDSVENRRFEKAARECYAVERIWKLLSEIEDLHLVMDPNDFLKLKKELEIRCSGEAAPFCFRSKELVEVARLCREMKRMVPEILEVEVDPKGGPGMVEAAMRVYAAAERGERVEVLQAMQGIEAAMKRFFYGYKQVVAAVMGSTEAGGNRFDSGDSLSQIFLEPTYFPSLDAAKTFLGYYWDNHQNALSS